MAGQHPGEQVEVIGGVDTHADTHTVAAVDAVGRSLGHQQFPADPAGYRALLQWLRSHGTVRTVGVEGTGSYGAGLARFLGDQGVDVVEVDRPNRKMRRRRGKSDPIDAEAAARAVLSGTATTMPKSRNGQVEALRAIKVARNSAVKAHVAAKNALIAMSRTAPEPLRSKLHGLSTARLITAAAALRPTLDLTDPVNATMLALRRLARRCQQLAAEIRDADLDLRLLLGTVAPDLLDQYGIGPAVAAQLLITAGDNPERIRNERAFAMLCGAAPIPASSGRTDRHRLNRGGDRQANTALHTVVICRWAKDQRTREYVQRRRRQGLSNAEIIRCLKRYLARELYAHVQAALAVRPLLSRPPQSC